MKRQQASHTKQFDSKITAQSNAVSSSSTYTSKHPFLQFRQAIGNQAFSRLIQAKLRIGQAGDVYEQEADRVAEQVMGMPEPEISDKTETSDQTQDTLIQRLCPKCEDELHRQPEEEEDEEEKVVQTKFISKQGENLIQRQEEPEEEEEEISIQSRQNSAPEPRISPVFDARIQSHRGKGESLPSSMRAFFEPRFGYDFSGVRIHTDGNAAETARAMNAQAFTLGRNIVFGKGEYRLGIFEGQKLLAHELTHVIQQGSTQKRVAQPPTNFRVESGPRILQRTTQKTLMRRLLFSSTMEICLRLLKSRVFHVS